MKITKIEISNIRGIESLVIEPGTFTVISGRNAQGKSSVIAGLQALVSGGHDPGLIRKGAESGSVKATLDDGATVTLTVKPSKSERVVKDEKGRKISAPQSVIDEMVDLVSYDPIGEFLQGTEARRVEILMESLPVKIGAEELQQVGVELPKGESLNGHGLAVLERLRKFYYGARRDQSRDLKAKRTTIEQLSSGLPELEDVRPELARIDEELAALDLAKTRVKIDIDTMLGEEVTSAQNRYEKTCATIVSELEAEIDRLRKQAGQLTFDALMTRDDAVEAARSTARTALEEFDSQHRPKLETLSARQGELKAQSEAINRAEGTKRVIEGLQTEAERLALLVEESERALAGLETLKAKLASEIPISGLEIAEGKIYIDGIPLGAVNTAEQILSVAVEVALLRPRELQCLVMDGGERLDAGHLETLKAVAERQGFQMIVSRVTDEESLTVTSM